MLRILFNGLFSIIFGSGFHHQVSTLYVNSEIRSRLKSIIFHVNTQEIVHLNREKSNIFNTYQQETFIYLAVLI